MNAAQQSEVLIDIGSRVILNIGLGPATHNKRPQKPWFGSPLQKCLRAILEPGFVVEHREPASEDDEATIVVQGVFAPTARSLLLYECVEDFGQDCIAVYYPDYQYYRDEHPGEGYLFGPFADKWGAFDPDLFKMPRIPFIPKELS